MQTGNAKWMKRLNRRLLLQAIRNDGPVSRADLARKMHLSPATVSAITEQLLEQGLVEARGYGESHGGRRPVLLGFNPRARLVAGVAVSVEGMAAALMDLNCKVIASVTAPVRLGDSRAFVSGIGDALETLLGSNVGEGPPVAGVGIGCPGLVDPERGHLRYASSLALTDVPLGRRLAHRLNLPVRLENDMNVATLAERQYGAGIGCRHMVYVSVSSGIGAGVIVDERLYRGQGGAGELGHMTIDVRGPHCKCGNRGCLGVLGSSSAMVAQAARLVQQGAETVLADDCGGDIGRLRVEDVIRGVRTGDRVAAGIFEEALEYLGAGIANLVKLFAPERIVVGGGLMEQAGDLVLASLKRAVRDRALPSQSESVQVVRAALGERAALTGAGALAVEAFSHFEDAAQTSAAAGPNRSGGGGA